MRSTGARAWRRAVTGNGRPADPDLDRGAGSDGPVLAPALARVIVAVVICGFGAVAMTFVLVDDRPAGEIVLAATCLLALLGLQFFFFCRPGTDLRSPRAYAALVAQAGLVYLPALLLGQSWVSQPSFLAGSVLLVLRPRWGWVVFAAVVASTGVEQYFVSGGLWEVTYIPVNTATTGLYVYGLTRLARLVTALHAARDELATRSVTRERVRFAGDVQALLGASLSAIALRAELILRLLRHRPEQAGHELLEVLAIARRALADLRTIARVYRASFRQDETASLIAMLAASDIDLRVDLGGRELPPDARRRLAAVLRDGIAAVLRQPQPARCAMAVRQQGGTLVVDLRADAVTDGAGLDDLAATVSAAAGKLTTEADPDGRRYLRVSLPVTAHLPSRGVVDEPAASVPLVATRAANGILVAVLCGLYLQAQLRLLEVNHTPVVLAVGTVSLLGALALQMAWFSRPQVPATSRTTIALLGVQAVLVYLPWLYHDQQWVGLQGFLAGSALLVLRLRWGLAVSAAVLTSVVVFQLPDARPGQDDVFHFVLTLNLGLLVYGLTWMARTVRQLRAARQQLADAALAETRLRFAQDLHDMLGLSLSALTLKSELAHRLIGRDPARAAVVTVEMVDLARRALADVRSVTSGDPQLSLAEECRTAQALLTAAGLEVRMVLDPAAASAELSATVGTTLATVLREAVTNVLRHGKGEHCTITVAVDEHGAGLDVVNDGVPATTGDENPGSGLANMADRIAALGGELSAGPEGADSYALRVRVPRVPSSRY